jgi:hypothetical protein
LRLCVSLIVINEGAESVSWLDQCVGTDVSSSAHPLIRL